MATLEGDLIAALLAVTELSDAVSGRINWFEGDEAEKGYPYITLQLISDLPIGTTLRGTHHVFSSVVQLDLYAENERQLVQTRSLLIKAMTPSLELPENSVLQIVMLGNGSTNRAPKETDSDARRYSVDLHVKWNAA